MYWTCFESNFGSVTLVGDEMGLREVTLNNPNYSTEIASSWQENPFFFNKERMQLASYFSGELKCFDLLLNPQGTAFQKHIWQILRTIPYGETTHYGGIAQQIGKPSAARAVGQAIGRNPLSVVIPCHRVIGANGNLTGFAAGIALKKQLLSLEQSL